MTLPFWRVEASSAKGFIQPSSRRAVVPRANLRSASFNSCSNLATLAVAAMVETERVAKIIAAARAETRTRKKTRRMDELRESFIESTLNVDEILNLSGICRHEENERSIASWSRVKCRIFRKIHTVPQGCTI